MINVRFATKEEGQQLIRSNSSYYDRLSQTDIDWRARKEGATLNELIAYAEEQVQDITPRQKDIIKESVDYIDSRLNRLNAHLPLPEEIVFVSTAMGDEGYASAYTSRNVIFVNTNLLEYLEYRTKTLDADCWPFFLKDLSVLIAHELFHCTTRHSLAFRRAMYALIGFTVLDHDIEFPDHIRQMIMANPDVEHIDNYAEFTINGEKRRCVLLPLYNRTWAEACQDTGKSACFFNSIQASLIPLDDLDNPIAPDDVSDFWHKMGRNTDYVSAPEECLAVNFSFAIVESHEEIRSPKLIAAILDTLKGFLEDPSVYVNHNIQNQTNNERRKKEFAQAHSRGY